MFKRFQSFTAVFALLAAMITASGCFWLVAGAAAGAAGYAWVSGALVKEFNVSTEQLHEATIRALRDLEMPIKKDDYDRLTATLKSEFADGQDVVIRIDAITEKASKIQIRVGMLGNKNRSEIIYNTIMDQLS